MTKYLEFNDEKSHKFYKIELKGNHFKVVYGKIGSDGKSSIKEFDSEDKAKNEAEKLIKQKLKKGYLEAELPTNDENSYASNTEELTCPTIEALQKAFGAYEVPLTLKKLAKFEDENGAETFSHSFYIGHDEDAFVNYLDEDELSEKEIKEYNDSLLQFATTDGTGGIAAFWIKKGNTDLEKAPIISFGSEGSIDVVAQDIKDFVKMLSFGAECMDGGFYHYIEEYDEDSEYADFASEFKDYNPNFIKFREWMKDELGIKPVKIWDIENSDEVDKLIAKAQKKVNKAFNKWQYKFYPDPDSEEAIYKREQLEKLAKEEKVLLEKIEKDPTNAQLYFDQAQLEIEIGQNSEYNHDKIDSLYNKVIELNPNHIDALKELASRYSRDDDKLVLKYLFKVIELEGEQNCKLYDDVADCYDRLGEPQKALEYYIKDIIASPESYGGYSQKYIIEIAKKNKMNAIEILEDVSKKSKSKYTHQSLVDLYIKAKKFDLAYEHFLKFADLETHMQDFIYMDNAEIFFKKEAYVEAQKMYEFALKNMNWESEKAECNNYLGVLAIKNGNDIKKAMKYYKKAIKLDPDEDVYKTNLDFWVNEGY